jgi:hypothetical protein
MINKKLATLVVAISVLFIAALVVIYAAGFPESDVVDASPAPAAKVQNPLAVHKAFLPVVGAKPNTVYGIEMTSMSAGGGLDIVAEAGTSWVRRPGIWWPDVEPTQGNRNWDVASIQMFEAEFKLAAAKELQVILVVRGTPSWAQKTPPWQCSPILQSKLAAFGNFMYELVSRYSVPPYNVRYYELINEPDISPRFLPYDSLFGCWGVEGTPNFGGEYYADMLKAVYPRIKQANPQAQVLLGGLLLVCDPRIPIGGGTGCNVEAQKKDNYFLKGILENGGKNYFDGISYHSYDYYTLGDPLNVYSNKYWGTTSQTTGNTMIRKLEYLKTVLTQYNVTGKYIMATEAALLCYCGHEDTHQRAKAVYAAQVFPTAIISGLVNAIWFRSLDSGNFNVGLLNNDLTPRYSYNAFKTSRLLVGDATYQRALTTSDFGNVSGVKGNAFTTRGRTLWTIWSTATTSRLITLSSMPTAVFDLYGNPIPVDSSRQVNLTSPDRLFIYVEYAP